MISGSLWMTGSLRFMFSVQDLQGQFIAPRRQDAAWRFRRIPLEKSRYFRIFRSWLAASRAIGSPCPTARISAFPKSPN